MLSTHSVCLLLFLFSLRVTVCVELSEEELEKAAKVIKAAAAKHFL